MRQLCKNCLFWVPAVSPDKRYGECRVSQPYSSRTITLDNQQALDGAWPIVRAVDWCGGGFQGKPRGKGVRR